MPYIKLVFSVSAALKNFNVAEAIPQFLLYDYCFILHSSSKLGSALICRNNSALHKLKILHYPMRHFISHLVSGTMVFYLPG